MSNDMTATDRRSFLKTGALAAAPLAAMVPVAALADDGSKARLAQLEDERAIEALHRDFLRRLNRQAGTGEAARLANGLCGLADDPAADPAFEFSSDGSRATVRRRCRAELQVEFTGETTLEQMARLQGHGSHQHSEERVLVADYTKGKDGWTIEQVKLA